MTRSPILWGAGLACALGGAVAGNALGSTPVLDRSTIGMFYQQHQTAYADPAPRQPLPDHYPLVTKNGTVSVAELSTRGLYSQARYRAYLQAADYAEAEVAYEEYRPDSEWRDEETRAVFAMADPAQAEPAAEPPGEAAAPLQLAAGPADVTGGGQAKLVNVSAALAMR